MKHVETLLKKIGIPSDAIAKITSDDSDINLDLIVANFKTSQREVLKNDSDFIQPIKDEIRGEQLSKIEHKIKKKFLLSADEVKDKKFEEIVDLAFEKSSTTTSQTSEELQTKLIELTNENKRLIEEVIPAKENESKAAIKTFKRESILSSIMSKKNLIVSPEVVIPAVKSYLEANFNLDVDDATNSIVIKTKQNLNPLNSDGSKILTFDEVLDGHLTTLNVIKQSNGNPNPAKTPTIGNPNPNPDAPKFNLVGLDKAQQNVESLKTMKVFGQE
jgi:hypothetical protein